MTHEHHWTVLSRHPTSEGTVVYESCHCRVQRVRQVCPGKHSVTESRLLPGEDRWEGTAAVPARAVRSRSR
jgi:hypothetical protein